uniref:Mannose-P-dolichol utilization defect 1 protein homolog n=1 Tax=Physcomitrium patens TaxID=3218 RepID=A0A2K1JX50_PHYPA|nr:hypothetical protein PHYPA_013231 [Physcomitrium patens]
MYQFFHLSALIYYSNPIFFAARLPQIHQNWKTKHTGQLSFLTNFMTFSECGVRTFTSIQENAPFDLAVGSVLVLLTNGVVCAQVVTYGSTPEPPHEKLVSDAKAD